MSHQPDPVQLRRLLRYEPETGKLYWRERPASAFADTGRGGAASACARWNTRFANQEAFVTEIRGYKVGRVTPWGRLKAHRVIWAMVYGVWPGQIDHINGVRSDNRLANLRSASPVENARNQKLRRDNKHGCPGVYQRASDGRFVAEIGAGGRRVTRRLGTFNTLALAMSARRKAERELGYHPNHGRRA